MTQEQKAYMEMLLEQDDLDRFSVLLQYSLRYHMDGNQYWDAVNTIAASNPR
ncbi:hypothetical protein [Yoonia sp.]|uniref:hypothetical protein n=1 Tax=Yoonia sp. TaxID=2212373 RepID=UPI00391B30A6